MYPKILIQKGKHTDTLILCLNREEEKLAWLAMFHATDQWTGYYDSFMDDEEIELRDKARAGNWEAAQDLLCLRGGCEYEGIDIESVGGPQELLSQLDVVEKDGRWVRR